MFTPGESSTQQRNAVVDSPTALDLLGYDGFARAVARRVLTLRLDETPLTVGIFGEWGSGKTSFLKMIDAALGNAQLRPVWFQAWKYEQEDNLWSALIQTVIGQGTIHEVWYRRLFSKLRIHLHVYRLFGGTLEIGRSLGKLLIRILLIAVCALIVDKRKDITLLIPQIFGPHSATWIGVISAFVGIIAAKPEKLLDLFSARIGIDLKKFQNVASYRDHIAFLDDFTTELRRIVAIAGGGRPLVVVIDDLDRCLPEKALQVLEAIKMFLDVPGIIFLLAVDREVIERAVAAKYDSAKGEASTERLIAVSQAESYLEKLIQLPFGLPPLGREDIVRLVQGVCADTNVAQLAPLFAAGLPSNPRSVKRTLQMFLFMRDLSRELERKLYDPLLAKLIIIQERCRDLYRELYSTPEMLGQIETVARGSQIEAEKIDSARQERIDRYLTRYPLLGDLLRHGDLFLFVNTTLTPYLSLLRSVPNVQTRSSVSARQSLNDALAARIAIFQPPQDFLLPVRLKGPGDDLLQLDLSHLDIKSLFRRSNQILLIGPRGSGKTTLLQMIRRTLVQQGGLSNDEAGRIPLFITVPTLSPPLGPGMEWIVKAAMSSDSLMESQESIELSRLIMDGRCCIMFDGLDEAEMNMRTSIETAITSFVATYPPNQIIVSTKNVETQLRSMFVPWTMLSATEEDVWAFFQYRFGARAEQLIQQIPSQLGMLPMIPFMLKLIESNIDLAEDNIKLDLRTMIDRILMDSVYRRGLRPDVARLLLRRMASSSGAGLTVSEQKLLAIGRGIGLTDVQTLEYVSALLEAGLVTGLGFDYRIVHDLISEYLGSMD